MSEGVAGNVYHNVTAGASPNTVMPQPDHLDEEFAQAANGILERATDLARGVTDAHQGATAIIVGGDWSSVRKYFSLSNKYADWADYHTPAVGYGIHAWLLEHNRPVRLSQADLEAHPAWQGFGTEAATHPPMRGWLAAPLVDSKGTNWGLMQVSDKAEGEFTEVDERRFVELAELVSAALEALWGVRLLRAA